MTEVLFANLLFAHLLADFPLQSGAMVANKRDKKLKGLGLYKHVLVVGVVAWLVAGFPYWQLALFVAVIHGVIDFLKVGFTRNGPRAFALDQVVHIGFLYCIAAWFCQRYVWTQWAFIPSQLTLTVPVLACAYLFCLWPANYFVREVICYCKLKDNINRAGKKISAEDVKRSGMLIGAAERVLILSFILMGSVEAAGLTIAAKSLLRFNDTEGPRTEYVLAGTLLSLLAAVICAIAIYWFALDVDLINLMKTGKL